MLTVLVLSGTAYCSSGQDSTATAPIAQDTCFLLIPCAEIDTAAAYRSMLDQTAKSIAIDRAKCLYREWSLLNATEELHLKMAAAKLEERQRCDQTIASLSNALEQERIERKRQEPWSNFGKVTAVFLTFLSGVVVVEIAK